MKRNGSRVLHKRETCISAYDCIMFVALGLEVGLRHWYSASVTSRGKTKPKTHYDKCKNLPADGVIEGSIPGVF